MRDLPIIESPKRITKKTLIDWMNKKFDQLEMPHYRVYDIVRTRFTSDQYEGGARKLEIHVRDNRWPENEFGSSVIMSCFYAMREMQEHLNSGCFRLVLKMSHRHRNANVFLLQYLELELERI